MPELQQLKYRATKDSVVVMFKDCSSALLQRARLSGFSIEHMTGKVVFSHVDHDEVDRFRSYLKSMLPAWQRRPADADRH